MLRRFSSRLRLHKEKDSSRNYSSGTTEEHLEDDFSPYISEVHEKFDER